MSFNPVGTWLPPTVLEEPVGAFEVSKSRRICTFVAWSFHLNPLLIIMCIVQVACAVIYCLLAAGIVFGYAAIKPVLVQEGVYRRYCTEKELKDGVRVCYEQEIRYGCLNLYCSYMFD